MRDRIAHNLHQIALALRPEKRYNVAMSDLQAAFRDAADLAIPRWQEIGGVVLRRGLVQVPNAYKHHAFRYAPDDDAADRLLSEDDLDGPFIGLWHTHWIDRPPKSKLDIELARAIGESGGACLMVVSPHWVYLLDWQGKRWTFPRQSSGLV